MKPSLSQPPATPVGIIGMGYVGQCLAAFLLERGVAVRGYDVDGRTVAVLRKGDTTIREPGLSEALRHGNASGRLQTSDQIGDLRPCDVVLATVGTPLGANNEADFSAVRAFANSFGPHVRSGQLIVLKSTVVPGTTRDVVLPIFTKSSKLVEGRDFFLCYAPERLAEGAALQDLRRVPVVVGGVSPPSAKRAAEFFQSIGCETFSVGSAEEAEFAKLADNLWIDLNVALANELAKLAERLGVNAMTVIRAANTLPKGQHMVNILTPGPGVGGSCLTKDPWFVDRLARKLGLELRLPANGRTVNESMPQHAVDLLDGLIGADHRGSKIVVVGLAFKGNTNDVRFSPAQGVIKTLRERGFEVNAWDPLVSPDVAEKEFGVRNDVDLLQAARGAQGIIVVTPQPGLLEVSLASLAKVVAPECVLVDGRFAYRGEKARAHGFRYVSIGNGGE